MARANGRKIFGEEHVHFAPFFLSVAEVAKRVRLVMYALLAYLCKASKRERERNRDTDKKDGDQGTEKKELRETQGEIVSTYKIQSLCGKIN